MTFTVLITVEVEADSPQDAEGVIRHALANGRLAEIVVQEFTIIAEREDEP